jgi:hypothetical protein
MMRRRCCVCFDRFTLPGSARCGDCTPGWQAMAVSRQEFDGFPVTAVPVEVRSGHDLSAMLAERLAALQ